MRGPRLVSFGVGQSRGARVCQLLAGKHGLMRQKRVTRSAELLALDLHGIYTGIVLAVTVDTLGALHSYCS